MTASEATPPVPAPERIMSVDALRGFDMFWITGGQKILFAFLALFLSPIPQGVVTQLSHKDWEGFAAWDLIMPLFLFITGVSMPFSFAKYTGAGFGKTGPLMPSRKKLYIKIGRRVLILFVLGMIAQGNLLSFNIAKLHLYSNTLQSIACGYLVASILLLNVSVATQLMAIGALLYGFWFLIMLVPVPGHGAGFLEPTVNFAMYVDETILGRFRDGTHYTWILSSMGFAGSVLLGVMGGHVLRSRKSKAAKVLMLFGAGLACLAVGWLWSLWFPIIKHIWTSSMVLWAAGWSFLLLALFYLVIDVLGFRKWAFVFVVVGMNAIVAYMVGEAFDLSVLTRQIVSGLSKQLSAWGALLEAAAPFVLLWLVLYYMYKKKTFVRVG